MKKRVMIMIDQATRDAFSQLLIAKYLARKGACVRICNQHTMIGMFERFRPHVTYVSWLTSGPLMDFLIRNHHRTHIALNDQEGGRMGEMPFKRSFLLLNDGVKAAVGGVCAKIFVWGNAQARWLLEMGIVPEKIAVTGSPRFDPYLICGSTPQKKYLGVTLRGDLVTALPLKFMENVFHFATFDSRHGIGIAYPLRAQFEDKMWHIVAATRYLFKTATEFSKQSPARIVFRPGPWEQYRRYAFLPERIPSASIEPHTLQHEYVRNAFALLDESSSMGLEGLLAGVPVISMQALIPRLEEHIAGEGGGLFTAPYMECYWRPKTVEEAVELLLKAEQGKLVPSPCPDRLQQYFREYHGWPRTRPSSFQIGDGILELLDLAEEDGETPAQNTVDLGLEKEPWSAPSAEAFSDGKIISGTPDYHGLGRMLKKCFFRYVPGAVNIHKAKSLCQDLLSPDRELWVRYHYYDWLYRHHNAVDSMFESLWEAYEATPVVKGG